MMPIVFENSNSNPIQNFFGGGVRSFKVSSYRLSIKFVLTMDQNEVAVARKLINWIRTGVGSDRHAIAKLNHFVQLLVEETTSTKGQTACAGDVQQGVTAEFAGLGQTSVQRQPPSTGRLPAEVHRRPGTQKHRPASPYRMTSTGFIPTIKAQPRAQVKSQGHDLATSISNTSNTSQATKPFAKGRQSTGHPQPWSSKTKIPQFSYPKVHQLPLKLSNSQIPRSTVVQSGLASGAGLRPQRVTATAHPAIKREYACVQTQTPDSPTEPNLKPESQKEETEERRSVSRLLCPEPQQQLGNAIVRRLVTRSRIPSFRATVPESSLPNAHVRPATIHSEPKTDQNNNIAVQHSPPSTADTQRYCFDPTNDSPRSVVEHSPRPVFGQGQPCSERPVTFNFSPVQNSRPGSANMVIEPTTPRPMSQQDSTPRPLSPIPPPTPHTKRFRTKEHFTWISLS